MSAKSASWSWRQMGREWAGLPENRQTAGKLAAAVAAAWGCGSEVGTVVRSLGLAGLGAALDDMILPTDTERAIKLLADAGVPTDATADGLEAWLAGVSWEVFTVLSLAPRPRGGLRQPRKPYPDRKENSQLERVRKALADPSIVKRCEYQGAFVASRLGAILDLDASWTSRLVRQVKGTEANPLKAAAGAAGAAAQARNSK